jgi:hypothetical protein
MTMSVVVAANEKLTPEMKFECSYCNKSFAKETTLMVHVCEKKKRYQSQNETGIQIGLRAYQKFYAMNSVNGQTKSFDDFAASPYYRAFARFGQYCVSIRAVNVPRFSEWLLKHNKKIDYWCKDSVYEEYLADHLRVEDAMDAIHRAIETSIAWSEKTGNPAHDYVRYGNDNTLCHAVTSGRLSPWALYNSDSGVEFLSRLTSEQVAMIWSYVDADFWQKKFRDYPKEASVVRDILKQAGW